MDGGRDGSVGITSIDRLFHLNPSRGKGYFLPQNVQTEYGIHSVSCSTDNGDLSPVIKRPERKAVHDSTYVKCR